MKEIEKGTVIQITESHEWAGCLAIVDEVKSFGCQAYVEIPLQGSAYIRLNTSDFEIIGKAILIKD